MMVASMRITSGQWRARRVEERRGRRNNASVGEEHRGVDCVDDRRPCCLARRNTLGERLFAFVKLSAVR